MAHLNLNYPLDYTQGPDRIAAQKAKERLREMAEGATE